MERIDIVARALARAPLLLPPPRPFVRRLDAQPIRPLLKFPEVGEEPGDPPLLLSAALRFRRYVRRERLT